MLKEAGERFYKANNSLKGDLGFDIILDMLISVHAIKWLHIHTSKDEETMPLSHDQQLR